MATEERGMEARSISAASSTKVRSTEPSGREAGELMREPSSEWLGEQMST